MKDGNIITVHDRYCDHIIGIYNGTKRTVNWQRDAIQQYMKFTKFEIISQISKESAEDFLVDQGKKGLSAKTRKNRIQALCNFGDWLINQGYLPADLSHMHKGNFLKEIPKPKLSHKIARHLSEQEMRKLLYCVDHFPYYYRFEGIRSKLFFRTMLLTGIRLNEFLSLEMKDVDLEANTIHVRFGKGDKERLIPIPQQLRPLIQEYIEARVVFGRHTDMFLASLTRNGSNKSRGGMCESSVRRLVKKIKAKSGVDFSPHALRHTFATIFRKYKGRLEVLKDILGHASIKTTASIYVHTSMEDKKEEIENMPMVV